MAKDSWRKGKESFWSFYLRSTGKLPKPSPLLLRALKKSARGDGRIAIDLGCGAGRDTLALLRAGFTVYAIDGEPNAAKMLRAKLTPARRRRVRIKVRRFEALRSADLPEADLVNATYSLFFCRPAHFDRLWRSVAGAIAPGGIFCGNFLGARDGWRTTGKVTVLTKQRLRAMFRGFEILSFKERSYRGSTVGGPGKRWHEIEIIARRTPRK